MKDDRISALLIEDDPDDVLLIRDMLGEAETVDFNLRHENRLAGGINALAENEYDVILLDLSLPDSVGLETFRAVHEETGIPIVVLTGLDDEGVGMEAMRAGAQDYLIKGDVDSNLLARALRYAIERHRLESELARALNRLDREFEIIANVQNNLLPDDIPELPGFDVTTYYRPAEWAGGDYFDFLPLENGSTGLLLADVSGRGAPAAVLMAMTRVIVHATENWQDPEAVLMNLNKQLSANIPTGRFVTATYGVISHTRPAYAFACAGHPPPLLFDTRNNRASFMDVSAQMPLGIQAGTRYESHQATFEPGTALVLYTDGVTNAASPAGEKFGEKGLAAALEKRSPATPEQIRDAILESLADHVEVGQLDDDTSLVILQAKGD